MSSEAQTSSGIAERYASAFFELCDEKNTLDRAEKDLSALKIAMRENAEFSGFLKSPVYNQEDQTKAIAAIAEKAGFDQLTRNFLILIAHNRRLFALSGIVDAFQARLSAHRGEVNAEAITAVELNQDQNRRLRSEIETIVGKAVNLETRVDPDLLGGMIVKVGSKMIDSSLKTKLKRLQTVMKEA